MDSVLADTLRANLKAADTPEKLASAQTLAMIALVDCQAKTAGRVKWLVKAFWCLAVIVMVAVLCGNEAAASLLRFGRG